MHPSPFNDLILHGENLFRTGYVHEALQAFESVIAQEPHHVLALNNKGVILHSLGMYAEAEQIFLDILDKDNTNTSTIFNLASLYIEQYNIKGAESVIINHKSCLDEKDINELKAKLYGVKKRAKYCQYPRENKNCKYLYGCTYKETYFKFTFKCNGTRP